jgi:hypothetical protein
MSLRYVALVGVLALALPYSLAAQDSVRLRLQIVRNGAVIANPEMTVKQGTAGRIEIKDTVTCVFTPTLRDSTVGLAFDIETGDSHLKPQLVLDRSEPGVISWKSPSGALMKIVVVAIP